MWEADEMKKLITILTTTCVIISSCFSLTGCAEKETVTGVPVYYLNNAETKLETHYCDIEFTDDNEENVNKLLEALSENPESREYKAPLGYNISLRSCKVEETRITLDFETDYLDLDTSTEVLVRAAIVQTLLQVKGIRYIFFTVDHSSLYDATGKAVGRMDKKTFIYNDGNAINTYDPVKIKLYFTNRAGTGLIGATREKFYSTNVPLELFVVEETIAGPSGLIEGLQATINPETNVISVTTSDGVCYVNLDSGFTTTVGNVPTEIAAYSLVNALTELPGIYKVQILVNGEVPASFSSSTFERNEDILTTLDEE